MIHIFTFLTAVYFCCLVILFSVYKIIKIDKKPNFSRFDFNWKWYLLFEDIWLIPINLLISIFVVLFAFALNEWL